jgi:hypothetical protein
MSGGKASVKQAYQYTGKQTGEGSVVTSRDTAAAKGDMHAPGHTHTHRKSMRLQEMSAAKQAGEKGKTEKYKQSAAQKKRSHTMRQAPTTSPALFAAVLFAAVLGAIPSEEWCRTWAAGRTIMLRRTSKRVKEVVDKMRLPAVVCLSRSFWDDAHTGTEKEKRQFVLRQLTAMTAWCRITTLELRSCGVTGPHAEWLAGGVLAQCRELVHLDLSGNQIGPDGAESVAGVLAQCPALAHLNLSRCRIGDVVAEVEPCDEVKFSFPGAETLVGVLAHLELIFNRIGAGGATSLAGVLAQCTALAHLNLRGNEIETEGDESFAGVLSQCTELAQLDVRYWSHSNEKIGDARVERLTESWIGPEGGLKLDLLDTVVDRLDWTGKNYPHEELQFGTFYHRFDSSYHRFDDEKWEDESDFDDEGWGD